VAPAGRFAHVAGVLRQGKQQVRPSTSCSFCPAVCLYGCIMARTVSCLAVSMLSAPWRLACLH
jgi:hypothetical protein